MKAIEGFLEGKNLEPETAAHYRRRLIHLADVCRREDLSLLEREELLSYLGNLSASVSRISFARALSVIRSYYAYRVAEGHMPESPVEGIRAAQFSSPSKKYLSEDDFRRMLGYDEPGLRGIRDRAMFALLCKTGLRVSELVGLNGEDYDPQSRILFCGAGKRRRAIPLDSDTARRMELYQSVSALAGPTEGGALFVNGARKRLTRQGFWKLFKECTVKVGIIQDITPQLLRHSLAYHRLRSGESPDAVRRLLGNADLNSLMEYRIGEE